MKWTLFPAALILCAGAHAPGNPASDDSQSNKEKTREPLAVHNPDGTLTIQRDSGEQKGLVIKPQVVTPIVPREKP